MQDQKHNNATVFTQVVPHFDFEKFGAKGVGKNKQLIINMDEYIDHSMDEELHLECCRGLAMSNDFKLGMVYGSMPPFETDRFGGKASWSEMLYHLEKFDPTGVHRQQLEKIIDASPPEERLSSIYKYAYFSMGAIIPWFFALYLKRSAFNAKTQNVESWEPAAEKFPLLKQYIASLPFKYIGRVLFFTSYPNAGVVTHRDSIVAEHKDHNINLFFSSGRPSYVWDEVTHTKTYLDPNAKSYFFNNRDYHGVDPEPVFRYTLRVDGTFTDEMCEHLGLEDGYTWKWDYQPQDK
jgi:hypothetical protein